MTSRQGDMLACASVLVAAILVLLLYAEGFHPDKVHYGLSDQVGYITTARWLAETGELRSHLIYPAHVDIPNWRMYMPGHYYALAAAIQVCGDEPLSWRIPGLAAFVLSALGVFLIGRKLYGRGSGLLAALIFLAFPRNITLAFSAMAEPTIGAASVVAFCAFVHLPERTRFPLAPFLLAIPFLFRESAALLVIPMACAAFMPGRTHRLRRFLVAGLGSILVLSALYAWQNAEGRSLSVSSWIPGGAGRGGRGALEGEADLVNRTAATGADWASAVGSRLAENLTQLVQGRWPFDQTVIVALCLLALGYGIARRRRDACALGIGLLALAAIALHLLLYKITSRHLLFTLPFTAVPVANMFKELTRRAWRTGAVTTRVAVAGLIVVLLVGGGWESHRSVRGAARRTRLEKPDELVELEALGPDPTKILVSSPNLGLDYALVHYPTRWSFAPPNVESLIHLNEVHPIGTMVVRRGDRVMGRALEELGLEPVGEISSTLTARKASGGRRREATAVYNVYRTPP